jgi:acyl-CoA dehydrogenase family protein 9
VDYSIESAISKVFATEMAWSVVDENLQIWGGNGYMKEYPYERWLRDARIYRIFEGTNEILRAFIALSGLQGPGQELAGLADAIKYPLKGLGPVTQYVSKKIKRTIVGETLTKSHPALKKLAGAIEEYSGEFANQVEILLRRHGSKIHLKQFAQKRIANVAIDLYAMSCVLSRVTALIHEKGLEKCEFELAVADCFFQRASSRIRGHFRQIDRNDDDSAKKIAETLYDKGHYPFDTI